MGTGYSAKPYFAKSLFAVPTTHLVESEDFLLWGPNIHLDETESKSWSHSDDICMVKLGAMAVGNRVYFKTRLCQVTVCYSQDPFGGIWRFPLVGIYCTPR